MTRRRGKQPITISFVSSEDTLRRIEDHFAPIASRPGGTIRNKIWTPITKIDKRNDYRRDVHYVHIAKNSGNAKSDAYRFAQEALNRVNHEVGARTRQTSRRCDVTVTRAGKWIPYEGS